MLLIKYLSIALFEPPEFPACWTEKENTLFLCINGFLTCNCNHEYF